MAGSKTWADGDVPSAADLNGYFRDQVVTIGTSDPTTTQTARPSARTDQRAIKVWDGAAHVEVARWGVWAGWTTLTLGGTWSHYGAGTYRAPAVQVVGGVVHLAGTGACSATTLPSTIATLPTGMRPATARIIVAACQGPSSTAAVAHLRVFSSGVLEVWNVESGASTAWNGYVSLDGLSFELD